MYFFLGAMKGPRFLSVSPMIKSLRPVSVLMTYRSWEVRLNRFVVANALDFLVSFLQKRSKFASTLLLVGGGTHLDLEMCKFGSYLLVSVSSLEPSKLSNQQPSLMSRRSRDFVASGRCVCDGSGVSMQ